jgi:DNA-binding beta-propeller fold protein YncE
VDTRHFTLISNVAVATHPEGLVVDPGGHRVFANIADSNEVAVIDTVTHAITAHWKLSGAADNVPLAFDGEHQLLYVACRTPGTLIALDAATGKEIARQSAAGGADDLFYDPALRRVYVIGGVGEVNAYQVSESKALGAIGVLHTVSGAKTALFVPTQNLLYVGVPGVVGHSSEIRVYTTSGVTK